MSFLELCAKNMCWTEEMNLTVLVEGAPFPDVIGFRAAKSIYKTAYVVWFKDDIVALRID